MTIIIYMFVVLFVLTGIIVLGKGLAANRQKSDSQSPTRSLHSDRKCPKCSHLNSPDGEFCGRCGHSLKNESSHNEPEA